MAVKYQNGRGITKTAENRPKQRRNQYDKNMHHIGTSKDQHGEKTTEMISNNTEAVENAKMVEKHVNNNTRMKNVTSRGVEGIFPNLCKTQLGNVDFLLFISSRFLFLSLSYWYYFQSFLLSNEITFFFNPQLTTATTLSAQRTNHFTKDRARLAGEKQTKKGK